MKVSLPLGLGTSRRNFFFGKGAKMVIIKKQYIHAEADSRSDCPITVLYSRTNDIKALNTAIKAGEKVVINPDPDLIMQHEFIID